MASALARDKKQRRALTAIVFNGAFAATDTAEAAIAIGEAGRIGVKKALWIGERDRRIVRILAAVVPAEDAAASDSADRVCFTCPEMHQVGAVAEPLVEDA